MYILKIPLLTSTKMALVVIVVFTLLHAATCGGFNLKSYCRSQCNIGLGGNLCRCNAFHFAGKRAGIDSVSREENAPSSDPILDELPLEDTHHRFESSELVPRLSSGRKEKEEVAGILNTIKQRLGQRKYNALLENLRTTLREHRVSRA